MPATLSLSRRSILLARSAIPNALIPARFSTAEAPAAGRGEDSLFDRLLEVVSPRASVIPVLEKWVADGKPVEQSYLRTLTKVMKDFRRETHALQISHWMSDRRYFTLSPQDIAFRLGLIYRVHGIEAAEKYFDQIPKGVPSFQPHGALLNCYVEENNIDKAENVAQMMLKSENRSTFSYNKLMKLYSRSGQHEKVSNLLKEMDEKGIYPDKHTFNALMNTYGSACDVDGIEKLLQRMKDDPGIVIDWYILALAAKGYMQAGLKEKAVTMLKKAEELVPLRKNRYAFGFLLTLYGDLEQRDELYRIWNHFSTSERVINSVYMCMISSLLKLDDVDGAERILKTWESHFIIYDFRVPNLLISAYCKKHLFAKAEFYINKTIENGRTPFAIAWDRLASAYLEDKQIQKAVETFEKALAVAPHTWKPNPVNVDASLEYFEQQGYVERAENFVSLLRSFAPLTRQIYHRLLRTHILARKPFSGVLDQMKQDGFNIDGETTRILEESTQPFISEPHKTSSEYA